MTGFAGPYKLPKPDKASRLWAQQPQLARARRLFTLAQTAIETASDEDCSRRALNAEASQMAGESN